MDSQIDLATMIEFYSLRQKNVHISVTLPAKADSCDISEVPFSSGCSSWLLSKADNTCNQAIQPGHS